ncbi:MAG: 2-oxoglutarate ferredoxin oxidoreductase subunit alpha, partial [Gemmatimonadota bacterium]
PESLARVWPVPGTPGLEHRIGGLERNYDSGHISYDPENHARMTQVRMAKVAGIAKSIPPQQVTLGTEGGRLAVVGWGSSYGPIRRAVTLCREDGLDVSHIHIRYIHPFPTNLGDLLRKFERIVVPEKNTGQLVTILRSTFLVPAEPFSKVTGKPFKVSEIREAIHRALEVPS